MNWDKMLVITKSLIYMLGICAFTVAGMLTALCIFGLAGAIMKSPGYGLVAAFWVMAVHVAVGDAFRIKLARLAGLPDLARFIKDASTDDEDKE